jgi:hypothetical protein
VLFCAAVTPYAQCTIDYDFGESTFGVSPDPNLGETFVTGMLDEPYYDVLHILIPTSAADIDDQFPPTLPIDSVVVEENGVVFTDTVTSETFLPEEIGLSLVYNNNGDSGNESSFLGGQQYCASIQGTPDRAGIYRISIDVLGWATIFTPFNAPYTFDNFTLRVNCPVIEGVDVVQANSLEGIDGTLTVVLAEGVVATEIAWFNQFGAMIGTGESVTVANTGTFAVQVTTEDCVSVFDGFEVIDVGVDCEIAAEATAVPAGIGAADGSASVAVANANGDVQISWYNEAGLLIGTNTSIDGLAAGTYSVVVEDEYGCIAELTDIVIDEVDGIAPANLGLVRIFPNPVHDEVTVVDAPNGAIVRVMALDGKVLAETRVSGRTVLDASGWYQGLYLVNIQSEQGQLTQRLVVTR